MIQAERHGRWHVDTSLQLGFPCRYVEFREAGAARYLLRIESSNPDLYASIHPPAQKWENRIRCLNDLKDLGFMVSR